MNDTVREILGFLENGKPELQIAAAQILGELKPKDAAVGKALEAVLDRTSDRVLVRYVLDTLARIGGAEAIRTVARNLQATDAVGDQAAHLLAEIGKVTHPTLAEQFDSAPMEARVRILGVVAKEPSKDGLHILEKALFQHELTEQAARTLAEAAPRLNPAQQKQLREGVTQKLTENNGSLSPTCTAHALAALGQVDPNGSRTFLAKVATDHPSLEARIGAIRALHGTSLTEPQMRAFLGVLQDPEQKDVHEAVRELLVSVKVWPAALTSVLKKLIAARSPDLRLFALRALRACPTGEVARIALKFLGHQDDRMREAAVDALAHNKTAIDLALRGLQTERNPARHSMLATILVRLREQFQPRHLRALVERATRQIASGNRMGETLVDAALAIDGAKAAPMLLERAIRMRRVKRFGEASLILARLCVSSHGGTEAIYQLAIARLLLDNRRPTMVGETSAGHGSATMGYFVQAARDGFPLFDRVKKETMLGPEVLLRLARHFAQGVGAERKFGLDLLQHLATRSRGKVGDEAKLALRTSGL